MSEEINKLEETNTSTSETDLSKIKIRHIVAQRFKKCGFKKIIGIILLFCGGFITNRFVVKHEIQRHFYGNPAIQRHMPRNSYGKRSFRPYDNKRPKLPASNKTPSQNQPQVSTQTASQTPQAKQ